MSRSHATITDKQPAISARAIALWIVGVVVSAVVSYVPAIKGGFALDDWNLIVNDRYAHSLAYAGKAFSLDFLRGSLGPSVPYYRPLISLSFQLNYALSGPSPFAFHLTNVLVHALVAVLVLVLALRLTKSMVAAGISGLIFAVWPSHPEAVAWVSGRTDVLACLFVMVGVLVLARSKESLTRFDWRIGVACSLLFACALFSKENAAVFPLLLACFLWIFGARLSRSDLLKWLVLLVLPFVIYLVFRKHVLHVAVTGHASLLLGRRLLGVGIAYLTYLRMVFVPRVGCVMYDVFPLGMRYPALAVAAWAIPVGLVAFAVWARRRLPVLSFCSAWIFVTLLPVVNLVPAVGPLPADRYSYLPSVGAAIALGWLIWRVLQCRPRSVHIWPAVALVLVAWLVIYCGALTMISIQPYLSDVAWAKAISELDTRFWHDCAGFLFEQGGHMEEAASEYRVATMYEPYEPSNYIRLSNVWLRLGKPERAVEAMTRARENMPDSGFVEYDLGLAYVASRDMCRAAEAFSRAARIMPKDYAAWRNLAKAELVLGHYSEAIRAYKRAFAVGKPSRKARAELAEAYRRAGMSNR